MKINSNVNQIALAILVTMPGLYLRLTGTELLPVWMALFSGIAILGAAFLVLWACDVIQLDVSQTLALAMVALIAVLPEYAVDIYFTWMAGQDYPGPSDYAHYAIANMTGANRLLIGIGWPVIIAIGWFRYRRAVVLERERTTELFFLAAATFYAFVIVMKNSLAWYDAIIFIGLFIWYIIIASRRPCSECVLHGPSLLIGSFPTVQRRTTTTLMFLFAAGVIIANAEPFSEGLVHTGKMYGINEFLLVQWLAPLASEAAEFIVAIMFALRGQTGMALGALVSSKLNQWTLLVGMIPGVYGLSSRQLANPIPMSALQMHEILLTAAQSVLGVALLASLSLTFRQALLLFILFLGQLVLSPVFDGLAAKGYNVISGDQVHQIFSVIYILLAVYIFARNPKIFNRLLYGCRLDIKECPGSPDEKTG